MNPLKPLTSLFSLESDRSNDELPVASSEATTYQRAKLAARLFNIASMGVDRLGNGFLHDGAHIVSSFTTGISDHIREKYHESSKLPKSTIEQMGAISLSALTSPQGASKYLLKKVDDEGTPIDIKQSDMPSPFRDGTTTIMEQIGIGLVLIAGNLKNTADKLAVRDDIRRKLD